MPKSEAWHRRHAIQIVSQLPESTEDALAVLRCAQELVEGFLAGKAPPAGQPPALNNVTSLSAVVSLR